MATTHDWLHGLYEISKVINASLDLNEILTVIARETGRYVHYDRLITALRDDRSSLLRVHDATAPAGDDGPLGATIDPRGHALGHVLATRQALIVDDLGADPRFPADRPLVDHGVVSALILPLISGSRALGALGLFRAARDPFGGDDTELLLEVAEQTAIAVEHAHLYAAEKKRTHHLAIINEVAKQALATLDLNTLLKQAVSLIQRHFAYYDVAIFMVDRATDEVVLTAQAGAYQAESAIGYRQPLGVGMVGWAAKTGQTLVASDVTKNPHYIIAFDGERASRSELCVPIKIGGSTVGVINIECTRVGAFDQTDVTAMRTLSDQVAQAIENARLYDEMRYLRELDESILASIPSAILVVDRGLAVASVNERCCRVLERPREEIIGRGLEHFFRFDLHDSELLRRTIQRVVDDEQRASFAAIHVGLPNGRERTIDIYLSPVARRDQRRALVFMSDITDRRRAEEDALREKQKLDDIVSAMGAGLVLIGRDHAIVWANSTIRQWFGRDEGLVGQPCHTICGEPGATAICPGCLVEAVLNSGETHQGTQTVVHGPQGTRHYQNIFAPIRDEDGNIGQVIRLTIDVTEHVHKVEQITLLQKLSQAMQGQLELDRLLHLILTCVTAGPGLGFNRAVLLLVDSANGVLAGRLGVGPSSGNEAARIWRELSLKDAQTLDDLVALFDEPVRPGDTSMQYLAHQIRVHLTDHDHVLIRCLREEHPIVVVDAAADPGVPAHLNALLGTPRFVCAPLMARGKVLGVVLADKIFTGQRINPDDVEILKTFASHAGVAIAAAAAFERLEEQLNELEQTQDRLVRSERLATVGRLAAHVAHEIRNPLVTIGGFARSILRTPSRRPRVERNAQIILNEVERLEQILANVMNFSKPGAPVLHARNVNETVDAICAFHENVLAERNVVLHRSLDPDCPVVRFDPGQLRQVLINFVGNALDSMPDGGELTVMTRAQGDHVEIVIADTGQGMTQDVLDNLFQPFYTTKAGGTGLGLSVSQKIIHDHGGDITVQSKPGAGSSFTITLPVPPPELPEPPHGGPPSCPPC